MTLTNIIDEFFLQNLSKFKEIGSKQTVSSDLPGNLHTGHFKGA